MLSVCSYLVGTYFPLKIQIVNVLGFAGLKAVTTVHLCSYSHALYENECAWLCSDKTLFVRTGGWLDLAYQFANHLIFRFLSVL